MRPRPYLLSSGSMAKAILLVFCIFAFSLSVFSQQPWREVDLRVNGIRSGTSYSLILKKLGKPLRIKNKGLDNCTDGLMRTIYYPDLEIELENYNRGKTFNVVAIVVTSARWKLNYGLTIGADMKTVRARFGKPYGTRLARTKMRYVTKGNLGGVDFLSRDNKLVRVSMSETLC